MPYFRGDVSLVKDHGKCILLPFHWSVQHPAERRLHYDLGLDATQVFWWYPHWWPHADMILSTHRYWTVWPQMSPVSHIRGEITNPFSPVFCHIKVGIFGVSHICAKICDLFAVFKFLITFKKGWGKWAGFSGKEQTYHNLHHRSKPAHRQPKCTPLLINVTRLTPVDFG